MSVRRPAKDIPIARRPEARARRLWWRLLHGICWVWFKVFYHHRGYGVENIAAAGSGPVIYISNHQSFFDPIIVGLTAWQRPFYALARSSLYLPGLGWLIRSLNAIPVDRGQADMSAMRRCLDVLTRGYALLVFPEGTRTLDGSVKEFNPGTILLIKRSGAMVVPVAISGAYHVWPRQRKTPRLFGRVKVLFGPPVPAAALLDKPPEEALTGLRDQIEAMRRQLQGRLD